MGDIKISVYPVHTEPNSSWKCFSKGFERCETFCENMRTDNVV